MCFLHSYCLACLHESEGARKKHIAHLQHSIYTDTLVHTSVLLLCLALGRQAPVSGPWARTRMYTHGMPFMPGERLLLGRGKRECQGGRTHTPSILPRRPFESWMGSSAAAYFLRAAKGSMSGSEVRHLVPGSQSLNLVHLLKILAAPGARAARTRRATREVRARPPDLPSSGKENYFRRSFHPLFTQSAELMMFRQLILRNVSATRGWVGPKRAS